MSKNGEDWDTVLHLVDPSNEQMGEIFASCDDGGEFLHDEPGIITLRACNYIGPRDVA